MAIFTRSNGDAQGVVNVDVGTAGTGIGTIISTGIGKHPTMYLIDTGSATLVGKLGANSAVEAILRTVTQIATVIAYQVEDDSSGEMRVLVESTGWTGSDLQTAIQALATVDSCNLSSTTVSVVGLKS